MADKCEHIAVAAAGTNKYYKEKRQRQVRTCSSEYRTAPTQNRGLIGCADMRDMEESEVRIKGKEMT